MESKQCPYCGHDILMEEGAAARFCPHCGKSLSPVATRDPSPLEQRINKEKNPKKKYKIIMQALENAPDDFEANRALLYHGRLHEGLAGSKGLDYGIIKCHLMSVLHTPDAYTPEALAAKYEELLRGPQLQRTMALSPDADAFFAEYIFDMAHLYVSLFVRGDSKNNSLAFGFSRSEASTARRCAAPVRAMLAEAKRSEHLTPQERTLLHRAVRVAYTKVFPGYESYLDE